MQLLLVRASENHNTTQFWTHVFPNYTDINFQTIRNIISLHTRQQMTPKLSSKSTKATIENPPLVSIKNWDILH